MADAGKASGSATTLVLDNGFGDFLKRLGPKPSTTIRFFERNDFYTVHHEDAYFVAKDYYRTLGVVKQLGRQSDPIPSVSLSKLVFETTVRDLLLVRQYRCELWTRSKSSGFKLSRKASPGNLQQFEDYIFRNADVNTSSTIMAIKSSGTMVGVAFCDVTANKIGVCEFQDNDQFTTFESVMVQLGAKECLYDSAMTTAEGVKVMQIAERSGMLNTPRKKKTFDTKDIVQDLDRLLKLPAGTTAAAIPELDLKHAMGAVATLLGYLELLDNDDNFGSFVLARFDSSQYMRLDTAATQALNLFPSAMDGGNKTMSILGILDSCKTAQGKRLLSQWIKQPLLDKALIDERLNLVEVFYNGADLRDGVREDVLRKVPDLNRLAKKFYRRKAALQDVVRLYQALELLPSLFTMLESYDDDHSALVKEAFASPIKESAQEFEKYKALVEATINLQETENHEYLIREDYSPSLKEIKDQMEEAQEKVPSIGKRAAKDLGLDFGKGVKLENDTRNGYYFRISRQNDKILRTMGKKFTTLETQKNGVKFTNRELTSVNEKYEALKSQYEEEQSTVVDEVLKIAAGYAGAMESLNDVTAVLDVIQSLAQVAMNAPVPYVRPTVYERGTGIIKLEDSRHPCVEVQDEISFIANNVEMIKRKSHFNIITGPNMGGKSTYIRQIGVNVLLAQIGSFVPCNTAEITIVDSILARVGAGDSQLKGVSTFMAEMLETASIIKSATPDSLIIVDELGRGTSTYDGFGLAWAISEHIVSNLQSFCLFATHFHELTRLDKEHEGVTNLHVTAHTTTDSLTLLYQVKAGICDQSFGINVAELANFPSEVIEHAKRKAAELEDFSEEPDKNDSKKQKVNEVITAFMEKAKSIPLDATPEKRVSELKSIKSSMADLIERAGIKL